MFVTLCLVLAGGWSLAVGIHTSHWFRHLHQPDPADQMWSLMFLAELFVAPLWVLGGAAFMLSKKTRAAGAAAVGVAVFIRSDSLGLHPGRTIGSWPRCS
jgi:hypothetical protein